AVQTCAGDSLCVTACPVGIDTGAVMKGMRARDVPGVAQKAGQVAAARWAGTTTAVRAGLGLASVLPAQVLAAGSRAVRTVAPHDLIPDVGTDLPGPGRMRSGERTTPAAPT